MPFGNLAWEKSHLLTETELEVILAISMPSYELLECTNETYRENLYAILDEITAEENDISFAVGTARVYPSFELLPNRVTTL